MREIIGILGESLAENDKMEVLITNVREDQFLEYSIGVDEENYDKINQSFSLIRAHGFGRCGYDYVVEVFRNDIKENEMFTCFNCNRLIHNRQTYFLDRETFEWILRRCKFNRYEIKSFHFETPREGRLFFRRELETGRIDLDKTTRPNWLKYDGTFVSGLNGKNDQSPTAYLEDQFGNDQFKLNSIGYGYLIETTHENYEKFKGDKGAWAVFENVTLRVVYK